MRIAMALEPHSPEAKAEGCTCRTKTEIATNCPVHCILYYVDMLRGLDKILRHSIQSHKIWQKIITGFLILDIISRII